MEVWITMNADAPEVTQLVLGMLQTNCYLVMCPATHSALVIDPADSADRILAAAQQRGCRIEQILLTHAHMDHTAGLHALRQATGAKVLVHRLETVMVSQYLALFGVRANQFPALAPDVELEGGEILSVGQLRAHVINTPGHTPGGISLSVGDVVFTGDTLFAQSVGRTDLPGGSLDTLLQSVHQLFTLPGETKVYPGHGPSSTISAEKTDNPYA
jgi:hydroxyacylglutathione hydrolase